MAFQDVMDRARQFVQRYEPFEDCNVGDVATIIVAPSGQEYSGVCVGFEYGIEVDYESIERLCEMHEIVFPIEE